jgi:hypothetical protein
MQKLGRFFPLFEKKETRKDGNRGGRMRRTREGQKCWSAINGNGAGPACRAVTNLCSAVQMHLNFDKRGIPVPFFIKKYNRNVTETLSKKAKQ